MRRAIAAALGILAGVAIGPLAADTRFVEIAAMLAFGAGVVAAASSLTPVAQRSVVVPLVATAFALRAAVAVLLHLGSAAVGLGGFITGDDREYFVVSRALVLWLQGRPEPPYVPPYWAGELYLFGTWVYIEGALFLVLGALPLVPIFLNVALGAATAGITWAITMRLFGAAPAAIAGWSVALWPSLVLWSALNLKDALALALIVVFLWAVTRMRDEPVLRSLLAPALVLVLMQSLRGYIFTGLAILLPLAGAIVTGLPPRSHARVLVAAIAVGGGALALDQTGIGLGPRLLEHSEMYRTGMAIGARTAIAPSPPVQVRTGTTFAVAELTDGSVPARSPQVVHVPPQTRIVVGTPPATPRPGVVYVQPQDIVVVGPPETTPAPVQERVPFSAQQLDLVPERTPTAEELALRTIAYLPVGIVYSLFAPWPWLGGRTLDLLTVPEMLVWYLALAAAAVTLWRSRGDLRGVAIPALFAAGTLLVFALVEGNWGTLYRHRSMVIPIVLALAAPTLLDAVARRAFATIRGRPRAARSVAP
jgi:hypothetical protein